MRVVFLSHYTGLGGGETSLLGLLAALDRSRLDPALVCPREGQLTEAARTLGVDTRIVPYRGASAWFIPSAWARSAATARIADCLRELRASAVSSDYHTLPYAVPAGRAVAAPVIFMCWGGWFRPKPWQRRFFRRGPWTILALSHTVKREFLGPRPFMRPDRVPVHHPGIDTGRFHPRPTDRESLRRELGLPLEAPLVTLIARFQHVKGHDVFLSAARQLAGEHPTVRFAVAGSNVFGGRADERLMRRIHALVEGDPLLRERVRFLGWVTCTERLLAASDVVVCSSRSESFGIVPVEAMASGVPVVSTDVGGPAETIVEGETGYLVPPDRPGEIARAVRRLLDDDALRRRMGEAGRRRAVESFSVTRYAAEFSREIEAAVRDFAGGARGSSGDR